MPDPNPETMSLDELRALVEQNTDQPAQEQPRDEQGRFKPQEEPQPTEAPEEETVYQRTIDLGDGSGVQVFEGKTLEELIDKLAKAQEHASRKIREQAQALKDKPQPVVEAKPPAQMTEQEKWLLQQRMMSEPEKVIDEFVKRKVEEIQHQRDQQEAELRRRQEEIERTSEEWVNHNPAYLANEKNGKRMQAWLKTFQLEPTAESLQKAFEDLTDSGLLEVRPQETNAETEAQTSTVKRIVEPTTGVTTVRRKVVGGLSTKRSAPVEKVTSDLTEDELYKLPMDQLERMTLQHFRS